MPCTFLSWGSWACECMLSIRFEKLGISCPCPGLQHALGHGAATVLRHLCLFYPLSSVLHLGLFLLVCCRMLSFSSACLVQLKPGQLIFIISDCVYF